MDRQRRLYNIKGFVMIEVIFAISISALIAQFLLSGMILYKKFRADEDTDLHAEKVFRVMAGYVLRKGCLPYPSKPSLDGEQFAIPDNESAWTSPCQLMRGIVPYKTLGLDEKYAKDGAGNYFTYIVTPGLCERNNVQSSSIHSSGTGMCSYMLVHAQSFNQTNVDIVNDVNFDRINCVSNKLITGNSEVHGITDCIALVLISHKNGAGSYGVNNKTKKIKNKQSTKNDNDVAATTAKYGLFYLDTEDKVYWHSRFNFLSIFANIHFNSINNSAQRSNKNMPSVTKLA